MKVLLISINAKYIHTNNAVRLLKANSTFAPHILEYTIKDDINMIISDIEQYQADVIGFSVYIWNVNLVLKIIENLSLENTKIVLGGPEVSYDAEYFLDKSNVDFIVKGEAELAFEELLLHLSNNTDYAKTPSISYIENKKLIENPIKEIKDLSVIKQPYYFLEDIIHIPNKISYIESSRGCPYKCSYCLSSLEKTVRFFDLESTKQAIIYLMEHGSKTIKFLDRTFNANRNTLELLKFIIENNNQKTVFQFEITGDVLDPEIIKYLNLKAPKGLFRFEIGIQSTNDITNLLVDRVQNTDKLFNNIKAIQKGEVIDLHLDLIAGLPEEDLKSFKNTFDSVFMLGSKELQLGFLKMLRGTKIRNESDIYSYEYIQEAPYEITKNKSLSPQDINEIHLVEHMLELHHNKGYFGKNMLKLILAKESPYEFFLKIGEHYLKNNYSMKGYQIEDIYKRVFELMNSDDIFLLKQDYLLRSKIKPKIFFENDVTKQERNLCLTKISVLHNIHLNDLYKHTALIKHNFDYFCVYYKEYSNKSFTINLNKTP